MTNQEIFDTVAKHLLTQKRRSKGVNSDASMYRGKDGLKCAIGCLITDEEYNKNFEGRSIFTLVKEEGHLQRFRKNLSILIELQKVHDDVFPIFWKLELMGIASKFGLNSDVIDQVYD